MQTEHRVAANPQTKPTDLGCTADRLLSSADTNGMDEQLSQLTWWIFSVSQSKTLRGKLYIGDVFLPTQRRDAHLLAQADGYREQHHGTEGATDDHSNHNDRKQPYNATRQQ